VICLLELESTGLVGFFRFVSNLKKRQNFEWAIKPATCIGPGDSNLREKALN
jgi:hypothetical protein